MITNALRLLAYVRKHPIGRRQPLRTLARVARWQIRSRLDPREHTVRWIGGSALVLRKGATGATGNLYFGLHECADMAFMLHLLRPGDEFLDIGANIGTYTVLAAKLRGARTIAFEPDPATLANLQRNIAANAIGPLVTVEQVALSETAGTISFTSGLGPMNRVATAGDTARQTVRTERLDTIAASASPVFIKLDVEGHEAAVLAGASETLARPSLLAIETEAIDPPIVAALAAHGFERLHYDPFTRALSAGAIDNGANNALFVRDIAAVRARLASAPPIDIFGVML